MKICAPMLDFQPKALAIAGLYKRKVLATPSDAALSSGEINEQCIQPPGLLRPVVRLLMT